jgi:hypothetical protein
MFRRRREASFRPPASSAWWPAGADPDGAEPADRVPALPAGDPFGGWPAFPTEGPDPVDPVLGQPDLSAGWGAPAAPRPGPSATPPPGSLPAPGAFAGPTPGSFPTPPAGSVPGPTTGPLPGPASGGVPGPPTGGFARPSNGAGQGAPNGRPVPNGYAAAGPHGGDTSGPHGNGTTGVHGGSPTGPRVAGGAHGGGSAAGVPGPVAAGGSGHTAAGTPGYETASAHLANRALAEPNMPAEVPVGPGAAGRAAGPGAAAAGAGQATPSWLPLLTHADDDQRFQANPEDPAGDTDPSAAERTGLHLVSSEEPGRDSRRARSGRRRASKARRPAADLPEPAASPETGAPAPADRPAPTPAPAPPLDLAFANGATTWLDPVAPVNPMEAAALAGAFAADYLSWDEASPNRRGQVLMQYLPSDVVGTNTSAALLGWSGKGRQRAEFSLPGAVHPDGDCRVVVDVRVRVTPYRAVGQPAEPAPAGELEVAGVPAVAPAPTARGWKSLDSYWVRMTVPIIRDQGRLVVDTWDEQLNEDDDPAGQDGEPELAGAEETAAELTGGGR